MKKVILFALTAMFLTSCGKFKDGTSVWAGQLWVIPVVFGILGGLLTYFGYRSWKSASEQQDLTVQPGQPGGWKQFDENVKWYKVKMLVGGVILLVGVLGFIIGINLFRA